VEERYTQEAVLADQRMTGLKQEAAKLHEQLKTASHQGAMQRYMYSYLHTCIYYRRTVQLSYAL
jgi:hypothetical protein